MVCFFSKQNNIQGRRWGRFCTELRPPILGTHSLHLEMSKRARSFSAPLSLTESLIAGKKQRTSSGKSKEKVQAHGFVEIEQTSTLKYIRRDVAPSLSFATLALPRNKDDVDYFFKLFPKSLLRSLALRNLGPSPNPKRIVKAVRVALTALAVNIKIRLESVPSAADAIHYQDETKFMRTAIKMAVEDLKCGDQQPFGINKIETFLSNFMLLEDELNELNKAFLKCVAVRPESNSFQELCTLSLLEFQIRPWAIMSAATKSCGTSLVKAGGFDWWNQSRIDAAIGYIHFVFGWVWFLFSYSSILDSFILAALRVVVPHPPSRAQ